MIIDCIADLHGHYPKMEGGDLLIVAGDLTSNDTIPAWKQYYDWLISLKYRKKIYIAGNHDNFLAQCLNSSDADDLGLDRGDLNMEYLCDSGTEFEGLKIWGSPWTPWFHGINPRCKAFTGTESTLEAKFSLIPDSTDILITHGPPHTIMDEVKRLDFDHKSYIENVGSKSLSEAVYRINPKLHVFGHIHERYGTFDGLVIKFINCSHVNERYEPVNKPIRVIL